MIRDDGVASRKISDGAGYFQDPVVGAGAEVQIAHGVLEEFVPAVVEAAVFLELGMTHACVAGHFLGPS